MPIFQEGARRGILAERHRTAVRPASAPGALGRCLDVGEVGGARMSSKAAGRSALRGADVAGQAGQGRGAHGAGAEDRDAEQFEAHFPVLGRDGADAGVGGDQRDEGHREAVAVGGDLLVGQARRAQRLEHLLHDQAGSGAAGGVAAPHRGELRLPGDGVPDAQGEGGEAVAPVAFGAVALHGGEEGPVGDGAW